jgi:cytosine/adenosine deaminase-related metal-dependent hydrolase
VGKAAQLDGARADRVIDARRLVVTPGFFNGHMHISYAHPVRGIFPDEQASPLVHVFNLQSAMTEEEEYHATLLGLELLKRNGPFWTRVPSSRMPAAGPTPSGSGSSGSVRIEAPKPLPHTTERRRPHRAFIRKWQGASTAGRGLPFGTDAPRAA